LGCAMCRLAQVNRLIWWRRDVARGIGRWRSYIGRGLGRGSRGRTDNCANRDARRDATPVWSAVVVTVAAAAAAANVHIPVGIDVHIPVRAGVRAASIRHVRVATVRHVTMEVVAVEIATAVPTAGRSLSTAAGGALSTTARSPLTTTTTATTTSTILHQDQTGLVGLDSCIGLDTCADRSRNAVRHEWRNRRCQGAARKRHGASEQQYGSRAHVSAPNTWLGAP